MKNGGIDTKRRLKSNLIKKEGIVKRYFIVIIIPLLMIFIMCKQSENKGKKSKEWKGREKYKEFVKLDLLPKELLYPNSEGKCASIIYTNKGEDIWVVIITTDNYKKVGKHYRELLPEKGWTIFEQSEEADAKVGEVGSFLMFDKNNRELLISLEPAENGGCSIEIIWRPFTG